MSEPAIEERQNRASEIVGVVFYSILVLLVMLLWVLTSRRAPGCDGLGMPPGGAREEAPWST
jgi:hypothetical protein